MSLSLRKAATNLLHWNLKGQATGAKPRREIYLSKALKGDTCYACKIGLVMLGRWGNGAFNPYLQREGADSSIANSERVEAIKHYGPYTDCPVKRCVEDSEYDYEGTGPVQTNMALGRLIEHLFEDHKWSIMQIDKWLAEKAQLNLAKEQRAAGL